MRRIVFELKRVPKAECLRASRTLIKGCFRFYDVVKLARDKVNTNTDEFLCFRQQSVFHAGVLIVPTISIFDDDDEINLVAMADTNMREIGTQREQPFQVVLTCVKGNPTKCWGLIT
ncbi:hypothetical protein K0M31_011620 [Melipona bicolor]|uniref:Uncharacterized protein n=1 Tax=Melipona bicolor TaxID=60889 RepID=A0AA40G9W1_9HYME|nr:hypothetical protein K0M31_011620 [Melipona bicolor]